MPAGVSLIVLCGGRGRRMGGADKPLQVLAGRPMVAWVLERLTPAVDDVVISANRNLDRYRAIRPDAAVIADTVSAAGPLAGLAAALAQVRQPLALVCPGDAPLVAPQLLALLLPPLTDTTVDVVIPHDGVRDQHLFMLLRARLLPGLDAALHAGCRRVGDWLATTNVVRVDASALVGSFANVNHLADVAELEARLQTPG